MSSNVRIPDVNEVRIAGRLTRDAELRYLQSGMAVCSCAVAHDRFYRGKDGEKQKETTFVDFTAWDKTAENVAKLHKGTPVFITARLRQESWDDKATGQKRTKLSLNADRVQPLEWGESSDTQEAATQPRQTAQRTTPPPARASAPQQQDLPEDDIPF